MFNHLRTLYEHHDKAMASSAVKDTLRGMIAVLVLFLAVNQLAVVEPPRRLSPEALVIFAGMLQGVFYYFSVTVGYSLIGVAFSGASPWRHLLSTITMVMGSVWWIITIDATELEVEKAFGVGIVLFCACAFNLWTMLNLIASNALCSWCEKNKS